MIQFPNCKINLGLSITEKRTDGFHNLDTVFYPLLFNDALEFIESPELELTTSGIDIPGATQDNLLLKAYHLLKKRFPKLPALKIHLHKHIPLGAGLGGGSSDAAFLLMMLNKEFQLQLSKQNILDIALELGSDCPFFIYNSPCKATGRGEVLSTISLDLSQYQFLIVKPPIHSSTKEAFASIIPFIPKKSPSEIVQQPIHTWKEELVNDFEPALFTLYPEIQTIKNKLYELGAMYSSMSGSGSAVYGLFERNVTIDNLFLDYERFVIK